jgi:hypothetical protein
MFTTDTVGISHRKYTWIDTLMWTKFRITELLQIGMTLLLQTILAIGKIKSMH